MVEYFFIKDAIKRRKKNFVWRWIYEDAKIPAMHFKQSLPTYGRPQHPVSIGHSLWFFAQYSLHSSDPATCRLLQQMVKKPHQLLAHEAISTFLSPLRDCDFSHVQYISVKLLGRTSRMWRASKYSPEEHSLSAQQISCNWKCSIPDCMEPSGQVFKHWCLTGPALFFLYRFWGYKCNTFTSIKILNVTMTTK